MTIKRLGLASILEMLTALALIMAPSRVAWLILGDGATELGSKEGFLALFNPKSTLATSIPYTALKASPL
jgi:hypothetical protein